MTIGFVSIGSNIDKDYNVRQSIKALAKQFGKLTVSSVYESDPVGFTGDSFYNVVVKFETDLDVSTVSKHLREIELVQGRTRECKKFSSRTIDLDLILFGDLITTEQGLQIPRDDIVNYSFVLEPLAEIAGNFHHPISGISYSELWKNFDKTNLAQTKISPPWRFDI